MNGWMDVSVFLLLLVGSGEKICILKRKEGKE